jgi:hypothetical protein
MQATTMVWCADMTLAHESWCEVASHLLHHIVAMSQRHTEGEGSQSRYKGTYHASSSIICASFYAVRRDGGPADGLLGMRSAKEIGQPSRSKLEGPERFHFIQRQQHDAWFAGYQCSSCDSMTDARTKRFPSGVLERWRNVHVPTCTHGKMHIYDRLEIVK